MATFVDQVTVHIAAGNGGNGCVSVRREKFKPLGGPDGANGGRGGDVILEVDPQTTTLLSYHHAPHQRATNGSPGAGDLRHGADGDDLILPVPSGTIVRTPGGEILADLVGAGTRLTIARGGRGGLGNAALASPRRKAPGFALRGDEGEAFDVVLELKSIADVALVGFPSAGKSSLIATISAARPKIAEYPFTTLVPNLGVVQIAGERFTVADVPGLIPGASQGKGLGLDFLRHIERCAAIAHIIDCATLEPGRDPISDLEAIETELASYAEGLETPEGHLPLMERPRLIVLNKIDVPEARELAEFVTEELRESGHDVLAISTATHEGLRELTFAMAKLVNQAREAVPETEPARVILRPEAKDDAGFTVTARKSHEGPYFQVRGDKPERWVRQTDFANDEAVGYLADRLTRLGVEDELFRVGAMPGDTVIIGPQDGGVIFDWEPTMSTGAEHLGPRGHDARLEETSRPSRAERRRAYHERQDAKAAAREEIWTERQSGKWTDAAADEE